VLQRYGNAEEQGHLLEDHEKSIDLLSKTVVFKERKNEKNESASYKLLQTNIRFRGLTSDKAFDTSGLILGPENSGDPEDKQEFDIKDYQAL